MLENVIKLLLSVIQGLGFFNTDGSPLYKKKNGM